ncbi:hypothetical protein DFH09DRAFT_1168472 [Mycena vulgaris]|nr:hypothetical protein DFH09DRAFT_1168472 [Mycena vulgaris]
MSSDGSPSATKTVVVLGASYGGAHAAQLIAAGLPAGWRIFLIDRNSHVNHVYTLPRFATLPGHEHKAFIPSDNIFKLPEDTEDAAQHVFLHTQVHALTAHTVTLLRAFPEHGISTRELQFDYAVYALGSHLPPPLDLWGAHPKAQDGPPAAPYGGTKSEAIAWLKAAQGAIAAARSILVVGGGALGIQFATDIAAVHPATPVTLLHSRTRLLPRFDRRMHTEILQALESAGVTVVLGERLAPPLPTDAADQHRTSTGRVLAADLVLRCTGQVPNTALLAALDARVVNPTSGQARVLRTMQLAVSVPEPELTPESASAGSQPTLEAALAQLDLSSSSDVADAENTDEVEETATPYPHLFAVGDATAAFGAIPAGHNAHYQAEVAARNVLQLIRSASASESAAMQGELERYTPRAPAIKVSLGLKKNVYEVNGEVGVGKVERDDLNAASMWAYFGCPVTDGEEGEREMYR